MPYHIQSPRVVHETIDDETIVIDFDDGTYYSLRTTANFIWQLLENASAGEIVEAVRQQYTGDAEQIESSVRAFLAQLVQAQLIAETDGETTQPVLAAVDGSPEPFTPPLLEEYTDMQDLLLLDPIHDVDAMGWPARKP